LFLILHFDTLIQKFLVAPVWSYHGVTQNICLAMNFGTETLKTIIGLLILFVFISVTTVGEFSLKYRPKV